MPSNSSTPYDPLETVEGMFNCSLTWLAYYFKDRQNYGAQTVSILKEASRRYQDAIEDCEIQILDAKWYLEDQLAQNKARRAPEQSETAPTSLKRKLGSSTEVATKDKSQDIVEENPAKRVKLQDGGDGDAVISADTADLAIKSSAETASGTFSKIPDNAPNKVPNIERAPSQEAQALDKVIAIEVQPAVLLGQPSLTEEESKVRDDKLPTTEANNINESSKDVTGQAMQEAADQDYNFDSMFAETTGEEVGNESMGFDVNLSTGNFDAALNDQSVLPQDSSNSFASLLPGLETYANATGDDYMMNFASSATAAVDNGITATSNNDFELPTLGDGGFDDFLNDDSYGGIIGGSGGADDVLNDDSMMNLGEFDDSLFN